MLAKSVIGRVLLQLPGVGAYFALVVILYWRGLTDAGAVAILLGLLFLFKTVVDSGVISLEPRQNCPLLMESRRVHGCRARYAASIHENTSRGWGFNFATNRVSGMFGAAEGTQSSNFAQSKVGRGFDGVHHWW